MPSLPSDHNEISSSSNTMVSRKTVGKIPKHIEAEKYTSTFIQVTEKKSQKITKDYELNEGKILQTLPVIGEKHLRGWMGGGRWIMRFQPAGTITFRPTARHKYFLFMKRHSGGRCSLHCGHEWVSKRKGPGQDTLTNDIPQSPSWNQHSKQLLPPSGLNGSPCGCSHHHELISQQHSLVQALIHQALEEAFPICSTASRTNMPGTLWTSWRKCPSTNCVLLKRKKALEPIMWAFISENWKKSKLIQHKHKKMSKIKRN